MHIILTVLGGAQKGQQFAVTTPEFLIGRGTRCHLRLQRLDVSRTHCAIMQREGHVFLRDQGSTNGTILNRRVLVHGELPLADGDRFEVGPVTFQVSITAAPSTTPLAQPTDDQGGSFLDTLDVASGPPGASEQGDDDTVPVTRPNLAGIPQPEDAGERLC